MGTLWSHLGRGGGGSVVLIDRGMEAGTRDGVRIMDGREVAIKLLHLLLERQCRQELWNISLA